MFGEYELGKWMIMSDREVSNYLIDVYGVSHSSKYKDYYFECKSYRDKNGLEMFNVRVTNFNEYLSLDAHVDKVKTMWPKEFSGLKVGLE